MDAAKILAGWSTAKQRRSTWENTWQQIYDLMLPLRGGFHGEAQGVRRGIEIFDETAVVGIQEFASRLQAGTMPKWIDWAGVKPGPLITDQAERAEIQAQLDPINAWAHAKLRESNLYDVVGECFVDLALGTGSLAFDEDGPHPFRFAAIPQAELFLVLTPSGEVDKVYRPHSLPAEQCRQLWPKAKFPEDFGKATTGDVKLISYLCRDWSAMAAKTWEFRLVDEKSGTIVLEETYAGEGSNPWLVFGWSRAAGEDYYRGPAFNVLAAVKTCNLVVQLTLENAAMAIAGMWQFDDDGVINADTIELVPGTLIPRMMGGRGLEPLAPGGDFNVASIILNDQRFNIRKGLYNETLGPRAGTPPSATEVSERMADLARLLGPVLDRIFSQLCLAVFARCLHLGRKRGEIQLPKVDGGKLAYVITAPLARAQSTENVVRFANFSATAKATVGEAVYDQGVDKEASLRWLAESYEMPAKIIRTGAQAAAYTKKIAGAAGQVQQAGGDPAALLELARS